MQHTIPLFPLSSVLFPDGALHLQIFEVRYLDLIKRCHQQRQPFGVVSIKQGREVQVPGEVSVLQSVGCTAHIEQFEQVQPTFFRVPAVVAAFGGHYRVRGGMATTLEGQASDARHVVIEFPSREQAQAWYDSVEYQSILPLRLNNPTGNVELVDGLD